MANLTWMVSETCIDFPPRVNSPGLIGLANGSNRFYELMEYSGPRLLLQLFSILFFSQLLQRFLRPFNFPAFFSQVIAGIVVGQTMLKNTMPKNTETPELWLDNVRVMETVASFGYMLFLFLNGVRVDPTTIHRSGTKPLCIGFLSLFIPMALDLSLHLNHKGNVITTRSFFMTIIYSMTSFPVIRYLLSEFRLLNSEIGRLSLSAGIVSDLLAVFLMMTNNLIELGMFHKDATKEIIKSVGYNVMFVIGMVIVLRYVLKFVLHRINDKEGGRVKDEIFYFVLVIFLLSPYLAGYCRVFVLFGPFLFGLAIPEGPPLGSALIEKLDLITAGYLLPVFTAVFAAKIDLMAVFGPADPLITEQMTSAVTTLVFKFCITVLLPLFFKMAVRDSVALGVILCTKGIVELAAYSFMSELQLISREMMAVNAVYVIMIGTLGPIILKRIYDPSKKFTNNMKTNVMSTSLTEELRLLACVHLPANVTSITNFLDNWRPNNPLSVDVLHLVKLRGQAMPLFIAHDKTGATRGASNGKSYSENVVLTFDQLERRTDGVVKSNVFTAVSPVSLMHEDIHSLALDSLTSLVILPFHRRWFVDGTVESEDQTVRDINCNILNRSPCSVGILIDGKNSFSTSPQNSDEVRVAMIFLGGPDDHEALTFAKRFTQDQSCELVVFHLKSNGMGATSSNNAMSKSMDQIYDDDDDEIIKVMAKDDDRVGLVEKEVRDGPETAEYLKSVVNHFDLVIVGRRYNVDDPQTEGLKDWSEFPELGVIGDLLASEDFSGENSVFIVQKHK